MALAMMTYENQKYYNLRAPFPTFIIPPETGCVYQSIRILKQALVAHIFEPFQS